MRFLLAILFAIGLIGLILVIVLKGNSGPKAAPPLDLTKYATTDTSVRLSVDGPIVAESKHRAYRITVSRENVTMEVFGGYQNNLLRAETLPNNQTSYTSYIKSLSKMGFTNVDPKRPTDERGYCPTGMRFVYEVIDPSSKTLVRSWSTSCGAQQGNFKGQPGAVRNLFQNQVPNYTKMIQGLNL